MRQDNRDKRVELLQRYARKFFPATKYLDYALRVEAYTLTKAANLVMNVDVRPSRTLITPGSRHSLVRIYIILHAEAVQPVLIEETLHLARKPSCASVLFAFGFVV